MCTTLNTYFLIFMLMSLGDLILSWSLLFALVFQLLHTNAVHGAEYN